MSDEQQRRREGDITIRIPATAEDRAAYRSLLYEEDLDPAFAAQLVDAIQRNPDKAMLQLAALTWNTSMDIVEARAWLQRHNYVAIADCRWCGKAVYARDVPRHATNKQTWSVCRVCQNR